jgi:polyisoprenoid-binding protein YceI
MKKLIVTGILCLGIQIGFAQNTWIVDPANSTIGFEVSHLTVSSVTGFFTSFSGTLITDKKNDFEGAKVNATIQSASITTNNLERDKHLKEDDFFNVIAYPEIKFKGISMKINGNGSYLLTGELTIRDVTKVIELEVVSGGIISINNSKRVGLSAKGSINRFDYGLKWDDVIDSGGLIVGEKVDLILKIEAILQ